MSKREAIILNLKDILDEKGMSQAELSRLTHIRPAAISRLINNKMERVQLSHVLAIMRALEIESFDELMEITNINTDLCISIHNGGNEEDEE